ncbi:MAG: hypothetical protein C4524_12750 [Candidatus Zixiibacteriota bacterium]|nr:MAG: hypothetical protein C4524_12750 [candidate division Zixibacteria bacterium]
METKELRDQVLVILKARGIKLQEMAHSDQIFERACREAWKGLPLLTRLKVGRDKVDEVMKSIRQKLTVA